MSPWLLEQPSSLNNNINMRLFLPIALLLLLPFLASAQVENWSFTSAYVKVKDSTMVKKKLIDTSWQQVATWTCNAAKKTITMKFPAMDYKKTWKYDSMRVKPWHKDAEVGQYYYLHQKGEQDVMLLIYYPRLNKILEIGVEKGKQLRAKYEVK